MAGKKFTTSDFDIKLGKIITIQRHKMGISQKDLARHLGVSFQQIQKYECGDNRLSAARLYQIAKYFNITIGQLVDGATHPYIDDDIIRNTMDLMYSKLSPFQRRLMLQLATYIATSTED